MRLGAWPRLGIAASVVWMLAASIYLFLREMSDWQHRTVSMHDLCVRMVQDMPIEKMAAGYTACSAESDRSIQAMSAARWSLFQGSVGLSLAMLVAAWITIAVVYGAAKWILAGRKNIR